MLEWWEKKFCELQAGRPAIEQTSIRDWQSTLVLGKALALSEVFAGANELKRAYEFLPTRR